MKYTIEDLRNGKCAVINDGTLEKLKEVLKLAFPEDISIPAGNANFYKVSKIFNRGWTAMNYNSLPTQSVKDFLSFNPKRGDTVLVWNHEDFAKFERIFITKIEGAKFPIACADFNDYKEKSSIEEEFSVELWKYMGPIIPIKEPKIIELTIEEIAKKLNLDPKNIRIKDK